MREYESIFVLNPSADEAQVDAELTKIREFLTSQNSEITEIQKWGRRKMAYEVNKNKEGVYTLIRFNGGPEVPAELNRRFRLNENMLRFLTVLYEKPPVAEGAAEEERAERRPGGEKTAGSGSDQEPAKKDSGPDKEPVKISGETATDSGDKEQRGDAPE